MIQAPPYPATTRDTDHPPVQPASPAPLVFAPLSSDAARARFIERCKATRRDHSSPAPRAFLSCPPYLAQSVAGPDILAQVRRLLPGVQLRTFEDEFRDGPDYRARRDRVFGSMDGIVLLCPPLEGALRHVGNVAGAKLLAKLGHRATEELFAATDLRLTGIVAANRGRVVRMASLLDCDLAELPDDAPARWAAGRAEFAIRLPERDVTLGAALASVGIVRSRVVPRPPPQRSAVLRSVEAGRP